MSPSAPGWDPAGNAVHRLVQYLDVLAIAFNQFVGLSFKLPIRENDNFNTNDNFYTFERGEEYKRLVSDYHTVLNRLFPGKTVPRTGPPSGWRTMRLPVRCVGPM